MVGFLFCPYCREKLQENKLQYHCPKCGKTIYKHPSLTASILPVMDNKVLLGKRGIEPKKGGLDTIGGFLNYGEQPREGAVREGFEELGVKVKIKELLGIYPDSYYYQGLNQKTLNFFYLAEIKDIDKIKPQDDIKSIKWYPIDNLRKKVAFVCVTKALRDLRFWYKSKHH